MLRRVLRGATVLACAGGAGGCSLFFDLGRDQCDTVKDCERAGFADAASESHVCVPRQVGSGGGGGAAGDGGTGGAPDPAWACLGSFVTPVPPEGEPIAHSFRFEYATAAGVPPVGLALK